MNTGVDLSVFQPVRNIRSKPLVGKIISNSKGS